MAKATIGEILRMFSALQENLEGIGDFDSALAKEIINDKRVRGREFMRFLRNRAYFELRHNRPHFFTITSDGRKPEEISQYVAEQGFHVGNFAESMMYHPDFFTTSGNTYLIGIRFGDEFTESERTNENIRKKASYRGWSTPPAETGYLSRVKISDEVLKKIGIGRLVMMHDPISDSQGIPSLFTLTCTGAGEWLGARCGRPGAGWKATDGFGFLVPQISL